MKMYVIEGTPEEITDIMKAMGVNNASVVAAPTAVEPIEAPLTDNGERRFVSAEFAYAVLTRLKLSEPLKAVLMALYKATPEYVVSEALYEATGYSKAQFAGLMGAFGRRMANTPGYDENNHFWDFAWDDASGSWKYRLPDAVQQAIKRIGLTG